MSTPPFLTRVRKRFDQPPYTGDGTENSKPTGARSCCFSSDSCLTLAILLNTNRENVFLSRRLRLFPLFTFCSTFRCLGQVRCFRLYRLRFSYSLHKPQICGTVSSGISSLTTVGDPYVIADNRHRLSGEISPPNTSDISVGQM